MRRDGRLYITALLSIIAVFCYAVPGAGRLACELYILLSCLLPPLMGGGMLTGMIRVMLPAQQGFVDKLAAEEKEKIFCGAKNAILPAGNVI